MAKVCNFAIFFCTFELCSKVGCISEIQRKTSFPLVFHSICTTFAPNYMIT